MISLLSIPEELYLLTVHEIRGRKATIKSKKFDVLLSASILMELALKHRIDTDLKNVIPDQTEKTGNPMLDEAMDVIFRWPELETINFWLIRIAEKATHYRSLLVKELVKKGLLKMEKERVFLGFSARTYPILIGDKDVTEVKTRIRELVAGEELPDIRDLVIISIAHYGGLLHLLFSDEEIIQFRERIEQLARMDLVGQSISETLKEFTYRLVAYVRTRELLGIRSPEEKMEELVEEMKTLMQIQNDSDLPDWLRKGTEQYNRTLAYIRETGTNEIVFNARTGKYGLKICAFPSSS